MLKFMKIAIQGIKGSFHHLITEKIFKENISLIECLTFDEMPKLIQTNQSDYLVMAIENSIAGAILPNYNLVDRYNLHIIKEAYLPIKHQLMALKGQTISDLTEIWSHPMAINQCRVFLRKHPNIKLIEDNDTAESAKKIKENNLKGIGAIASEKASEIYGLSILAKNIHTNPNNYTRFFVLDKNKNNPEKFNKVSLKFITKHQQGSLSEILQIFANHKLNLTKIQSLPIIDKPWQYAFFVDLVFENKKQYQQAMNEVANIVSKIKILGQYQSAKTL